MKQNQVFLFLLASRPLLSALALKRCKRSGCVCSRGQSRGGVKRVDNCPPIETFFTCFCAPRLLYTDLSELQQSIGSHHQTPCSLSLSVYSPAGAPGNNSTSPCIVLC
ncbi:hypothetical protein CHARACLAT_013327 [Characodon lateralis]|uniref:Secreted protein n=1 Tax=Characodon lateralis TaxID=208331 RepID=A0ABU7DG74_9TELE|nr:hypothetical protein [Characodon lateralis]